MNVKISWLTPSDNFKPIEAYRVVIQDTNESGDFFEDVINCDGSNALILSQRFCEIPVSTVLRVDPYNLQQGQVVIASVQALNSRGWSDLSTPNSAGA